MSIRDPLGNLCNWKVTLHFKSLGMPRVPEFTALRNAQATFGQYGIYLHFASGESLPQALETGNQCLSLEQVDVGSCTMAQPMTGAQSILFSYGSLQRVGLSDILCYWVDRVESHGRALAGCASHPSGRPACVVAAVGSIWTLAHEVGHVLGLRHTTGTTMLMSTPTASITANPPRLSAGEMQTVKASPYCFRC